MIDSASATPAFIAAFAVLLLLLANVLLFTRFVWWVKGAAIALVVGLSWMSWQAMPELLGWPAHAGMPARFNVAGIQVIEPEKNGGSKGAIYLWVTGFATVHGEVIPRAFEIPFSPELQLKLAGVSTKLRKRLPQLGEEVPPNTHQAGHGARGVDLDFFDMPDPLFPER
jgi:hypothetical protein